MQFSDFRDRPLLFIDLEMTGLDPTKHEIVEVGALVVDGKTLKIKKEYEVKVKPSHIETADQKALEINGYAREKWKNALSLKQVLEELSELAPGALPAGWNIGVDKMFLDFAFITQGIKPSYDYHTIDVHTLAWAQVLPDKTVKEVKLSKLCKHFGIKREEKHRAMADIKATYEVFRKLLAK
ncbi:3'-5' exonuclease [Candidatus Microgenomates bacterium]|nr:3'-5' exonuclease [Candidatus Microgenomates bacterium]